MGWVWLVVAAVVVVFLAYVAWEFRWYWSTLTRAWRADAEPSAESERELVVPHRRR